MSQVTCYIGMGSNLGDSSATLGAAFSALKAHPQIHEVCMSSLYQSKPHGPQDQPDYINAVACLLTDLDPEPLLDVLQSIEQQYGRVRTGEHWSARTLDLDLVLFGQQIIQTERLTVPHPWMTQREFVLYPLLELAPALKLPDGSGLQAHLDALPDHDLIRLNTSL